MNKEDLQVGELVVHHRPRAFEKGIGLVIKTRFRDITRIYWFKTGKSWECWSSELIKLSSTQEKAK